MKRYGMMLGLPAEHYQEYKRYHAAVWPEVLAIKQNRQMAANFRSRIIRVKISRREKRQHS